MNSREFFYDFGRALYHVDSFYDEFAKQSNVSSALLWVLYALGDGNPHTQIEISNDWELPKTTVNTIYKFPLLFYIVQKAHHPQTSYHFL